MEFSIKNIDRLPSQPGIYIFKGHGEFLYIGKSVNIKARVKSHIESAKVNGKEKAIIDKTQTVQFYITENEFQAEVLEANLIKEHLPRYNVRWKDGKNFLYIKITISDEYPKVLLSRRNEKDNKNLYFGPFSSVKKTETILRTLRKIIPFCTQKKISRTPCFYSKIGLCNPCPSMINSQKNGMRKKILKGKYKENIKLLIKLLNGNIVSVLHSLEKKLKEQIRNLEFEEAKKTKEQINNLNQLTIRKFINSDKIIEELKTNSLNELYKLISPYFTIKSLKRIEAFDVSNLQGKLVAGAMVILINGVFDKSQFRRFKISSNVNDLKMLEELITRRFKNKNQKKPDLIIIDGGVPQLRVVEEILRKKNINIPLIGIAKNPDRIILATKNFPVLQVDPSNSGFNLVKLIRDTAHNFAVNYHRFLRNKNFFEII